MYALISGYVGYGRKRRYESIIRLWVETIFYCITINLVFTLFIDRDAVSNEKWLSAFLPVTSQTYWYLTAYVAVFLLIPVLNWTIDKMSKEMAAKVILIGLSLCCWDLVSKKDIFKLSGGYSAIWLIFLYFIGAYVNKHYSELKYKALFSKYCGWIFVAIISGSFVIVLALQKITLEIFGKAKGDRFFVAYTAPTVIIASIILLLYFSSIEIKRKSLIRFAAPATFGVYLIHNHPLVAQYVMPWIFGRYTGDAFLQTMLVFIIGAIAIFAIATFIERVRGFLFEKLGLNGLCRKCGELLECLVEKLEHVFATIP